MEKGDSYAIVDLNICDKDSEKADSPDTLKKIPLTTVIKIQRDRGERDYIGFATLPEQVHRKSVKRGFDFTLMVVGESGLGKSTLINSLFLGDLYKNRKISDVQDRIEKTTTIEKKTMEIEERGVKLRLTIVDTPGFGDAINCEDSWRVCSAYVDEQFRQYFTDESGLNRRHMQDNRVHCCLYFVPPWAHSLRQVDLEMMRRLHRKVNIVVVIAKADSLTAAEVKRLKTRILNDLDEYQIQVYQFPECDSDEDEEFKQQDRELKAAAPFAVVASDTVLEIGGKRVRGRQYPWGIVDVENPRHSDFTKLRTMLISTHMQDLKDVTQDVHYENFRAQCISQISQHAMRERGKLKRDSMGNNTDVVFTDTDRLLLQKDEEGYRGIRRTFDVCKTC
ncbi:septin-2 isoform X3 [Bicyclus anynana]|uniref:Septin-2 isoform X3 n=1 Tax=Bicyclus anynana TaxID=110368 RepID=A0A6J1N055_BICAN|nr:septin-2 isoform X3 [Bicyclus anynana]